MRTILGIVSTLFAVAMAVVSVVPVHAADMPKCMNNASALTGTAPLTVQFVLSSTDADASFLIRFNDGTGEATGEVVEHTFVSEGLYPVKAIAVSAHGLTAGCPTKWIEVSGGSKTPATTESPAVTAQPTHIELLSLPVEIERENENGGITGDGNITPNIIGNNNTITISINQEGETEADEVAEDVLEAKEPVSIVGSVPPINTYVILDMDVPYTSPVVVAAPSAPKVPTSGWWAFVQACADGVEAFSATMSDYAGTK